MKLSPSVIKSQEANVLTRQWVPGDLGGLAGGRPRSPHRRGKSTIDSNPSNFQIGELATKSPPSAVKSNGAKRIVSEWLPSELAPSISMLPVISAPIPGDIPMGPAIDCDPLIDQLIVQAKMRAEQVLQDAEMQAIETMDQTRKQAVAVTQQARTQGMTAAETEAAQLLRSARTIVDEVYAWRESMMAQSEHAVLDLVMEIAKTIFGAGLEVDKDVLEDTFGHAMADAKNLGDLLIHVHPEDAAVLGSHWTQGKSAAGGKRVELVPDHSIRRGGCLIEGQFGLVDARVETRMQAVMEIFSETLAAKDTSPLVST